MILGETRCDTFNICLNKEPRLSIYPAINNAQSHIFIQGPDELSEDKRWIIDGRDMEVPAGTVYQIFFKWSTERMEISWEEAGDASKDLALVYEHTYYLTGGFSKWKGVEMTRGEQDGVWEGSFRIGSQCQEEFYFCRDKDMNQLIYPARHLATSKGVPVCGPDGLGRGKHWLVRGHPGEEVQVKLSIVDAHIVVTITIGLNDAKEFQSFEGWDRHDYSILGNFNNGVPIPMIMDAMKPGVFKCTADTGSDYNEEFRGFVGIFQVIVDSGFSATFYPEADLAPSGEAIVRGPDGDGEGRSFLARSIVPDMPFDIVLDLNAQDRRNILTWEWASDQLAIAAGSM